MTMLGWSKRREIGSHAVGEHRGIWMPTAAYARGDVVVFPETANEVRATRDLAPGDTSPGAWVSTTPRGEIPTIGGYPDDFNAGDGFGEHMEIGDEQDEIGGGPFAFPEEVISGGPFAYPEEVIAGDAAAKKVIETARDNRTPPPKMRAVDVEAPGHEGDEEVQGWFADVMVGVGVAVGGADPFPLFSGFLQRCGAGMDRDRIVRVDTEESYGDFRTGGLAAEVRKIREALERHIADPNAHEGVLDAADDVVEELEEVGAVVAADAERERVDMWLPAYCDGKVEAWQEGGDVCASMKVPGPDGEVRVLTSSMPAADAVEEMARHAADADVDAAEVAAVVGAMGCVLGAGTLVKEMAAAVPAVLARAEVKDKKPFVCRIEPAASPTLCAFLALAEACARGDEGACVEWDALASAAGKSPHAANAMREAAALLKKGAA